MEFIFITSQMLTQNVNSGCSKILVSIYHPDLDFEYYSPILRKWLILGLGQEVLMMNLEHFIRPERMEMLTNKQPKTPQ